MCVCVCVCVCVFRAQELCVKVEVAVLSSPSLIVFMDFVDVKLHMKKYYYVYFQSSGAV